MAFLLAKPTPLNVNHGNDRFSMFNKKRDIAAAVTLKLLSGRSWDWRNRLSGWNDGCSDDRRRAVIGLVNHRPLDAGANHSASFDQRRRPETLRTAMPTAFFWPTNTTSLLPLVRPV